MPHPDNLILFKYADDIAHVCAASSCCDVDIQLRLDLIIDWSSKRALFKDEYTDARPNPKIPVLFNSSISQDVCFFRLSFDEYLVLTSSLPNLSVNKTSIPQTQKLKHLGVHYFNHRWSDPISFIPTKVCKLSFHSYIINYR